jgi:tRNA/rRNA methyltransferase
MTSPTVILVEPQLGENIGFTARAMLNCGLTSLRLVKPRDGWPNPAAEAAAAGADAVIEGAEVFETVESAIEDLQRVFAATARRREQIKRVLTPRSAALELRDALDTTDGLLFGPERSGLDNDAVALADAVIEVPLNPDFSSLSLPQAVLIVAYEWRMAGISAEGDIISINDAAPATKAELHGLFARLEGALDDGGFFHVEEKRPITVRNIRNIFQRAGLTDQEVRTLQGIVTSLRRHRR